MIDFDAVDAALKDYREAARQRDVLAAELNPRAFVREFEERMRRNEVKGESAEVLFEYHTRFTVDCGDGTAASIWWDNDHVAVAYGGTGPARLVDAPLLVVVSAVPVLSGIVDAACADAHVVINALKRLAGTGEDEEKTG